MIDMGTVCSECVLGDEKMDLKDLIRNIEKMEKLSIINVTQDDACFGDFYVHVKYLNDFDIFMVNDRNVYELSVSVKHGLRKINVPLSYVATCYFHQKEYIPHWASVEAMWECFESWYPFLGQITKQEMMDVVSLWKNK